MMKRGNCVLSCEVFINTHDPAIVSPCYVSLIRLDITGAFTISFQHNYLSLIG